MHAITLTRTPTVTMHAITLTRTPTLTYALHHSQTYAHAQDKDPICTLNNKRSPKNSLPTTSL